MREAVWGSGSSSLRGTRGTSVARELMLTRLRSLAGRTRGDGGGGGVVANASWSASGVDRTDLGAIESDGDEFINVSR